jgi:acyl carrier protein
VLNLPHVDADDNFFEIGGHSLAIVSVHARLAEALGREISVVDLFRYANIRALAAFLEDGRATKHNKHEEPRAWTRTRTPASTW